MRISEINRKTAETDISIILSVDGNGKSDINTGVGFMDHMLTLFAVHGMFDIKLRCTGDTHVDDHHSVEDMGIVLGKAFAECVGSGAGICRYGSIILPMDEALIMAAVDVSGRGVLGYALDIPTEKVGSFDTELVEEFWTAFTRSSGITVHLRKICGGNSHHIIEGAFKAAARSLRAAVAADSRLNGAVPSSKGVI